MTSALRLGVIGAGYWGQNLIRVCSELGVLDAVCDSDRAALDRVKISHPTCRLFTKIEELLTVPLDAVVIAAPAQDHARLTLQALCAGKQVFVEKPLALNTEEATEIVRLARTLLATVFVGHVLLYHPAVQKMLALVADGVIGDVRHMRSRRLSLGRLRTHENVWWSFAPHDVALMLEVFDESPQSASATHHGYTTPGISDFAYVDYMFSRRRSAHIEVGWLDASKNARLDLFGSKGILTMEDSREGAAVTLTPCGTQEDQRGVSTPWREDSRKIAFESGEPLKLEMQAFLHAIATKTSPLTEAREGLEVIRALQLADVSANFNVAPPEIYA